MRQKFKNTDFFKFNVQSKMEERKNSYRILGMFLGVLLVLSVFPIVSAESLREWNRNAILKYTQAKQEYVHARDFYKSARADWITAREKYRKYKKAEDLNNTLEKGKNFLMKADEHLLKYLNMVKSFVEGEPSLSESQRDSILEEINFDIEWLESQKPVIESAETKEDLVSIGKEIRTKWVSVKAKAKRITGVIMSSKINWFIRKAERLSERVQKEIERQKALGKDTSELEAWLDDFNSKLDLAKEKYENAKAKYESAKNARDINKLVVEGNSFIKDANRYLREAYKDLKNIVKELKASAREERASSEVEEINTSNSTGGAENETQ